MNMLYTINVYFLVFRILQSVVMDTESKERPSSKRDEIVLTGDRLFSRHGLKRVTVEEICREAGVSKMTFYKYFPGKLELFKHIWTRWSETIFGRLREMEASGASFAERMLAIVEFKAEIVSRMDPGMLEELIHHGPELEDFFRDLREKSVRRFFDFVAGAREKGEMRDIRPEFLLAVLDCLGELIRNDRLRRLYPTDTEFIREVNDFFFFGLMPKGNQGGR